MGNDLPCCLIGRPKIPPTPITKPVLRSKPAKSHKIPLSLPANMTALPLVKPRKRLAVFTPHLILKLLQIDLMRKAFSLTDSQLTSYRTFYVTSKIEENRKQKLADEEDTEETIPAPKYDLIKVTNLPVAKQQDLAWVLAEYKGQTGEEKLDGFLEVKKVSRFGVPRPRTVIFSTEALYVCDSKNLRAVKRRIAWSDLACVKLAPDDRSVRLELTNSAASCILHSPQSADITNAIKTLYHLKFKEFPLVIMAVSSDELKSPVVPESVDKQVAGSQAILRKYGSPHEKVIRCVTVGTIDGRSSRRKMTLLVSTQALYRVSVDFQLHSLIPLRKLTFIALVNDLAQALFQSSMGDYWVIHAQAKALVEDVLKTHFQDCGNTLDTQTMAVQQALEIYTPRPADIPAVDNQTEKRESKYYTLGDLDTENDV